MEDEKHLYLACDVAAQRREYESLKRIVASGPDVAVHLTSIEQMLRVVAEHGDDEERVHKANKEFFLRTMLPNVCTAVMHRTTLDDRDMQRINHVFLRAMDVVLAHVTPELSDPRDAPMVETLSRILNPINYNFFHYHRTMGPPSPPTAARPEDDTDSFTVGRVDLDTSRYLTVNINYFGAAHGFEKIIQRLEASPPPDVTLMKALVKPISKIIDYVRLDFATEVVTRIHAVVHDRLLNMAPEELRAADKKTMSDVSKLTMALLKRIAPDTYEERVDRFNLSLALKCFTCPYLDKRVAGLNDIKEHIQATLRRLEYERVQRAAQEDALGRNYNVKRAMQHFRLGWLTADIMATWIEENRIMELLYGETMHQDLLSRCTDVPLFLAKLGRLTREHIDLMWKLAEGQHEVVVHSILSSLGDLVFQSVLPHQLVVYIYEKLQKLPLTEYDGKTFYLLRSVCREAIHGRDRAPYGIDIAWAIVQDGVRVAEEVKCMAAGFIRDLLKWPGYREFRRDVMARCIDNLRQHRSVIKTLFVLKSVIETYGSAASVDRETVPSIILYCSKEYALLDTLLLDLEAYKADVAAQAERLTPPDVADKAYTWSAYVFDGQCYPHQRHINDRLEFLQYVLSNSPLAVSPAHVRRMWQCIVCDALCVSESDAFFQWFLNTCNIDNDYHVSEDVMQYAFCELMPNLDMHSYSIRAFNLFKVFFVMINAGKGRVRRGKKSSDPVTVLAFPLAGEELLWRIALCATHKDTGAASIQFLIELHKFVSMDLESKVLEQRIRAVDVCVGMLKEAVKAREHAKISRCLNILKRFVEEFDAADAYRTRHGYIVREAPIEIHVQPSGGKKFTIHTFANETVGGLRAKVGKALGEHPKRIRLLFCANQLVRDNEWLWALRVYSRSTVHAVVNPTARVDGGAGPSARALASSPSRVLAGGAYFDQVFQLLNMGKEIGAEAWELIKMLPTNEACKTSVRDTANARPDWNGILDPRSTFKLLYSLQVVDSLTEAEEGARDDSGGGGAATSHAADEPITQSMGAEARGRWRHWFIDTGGLKHLMAIALSCRDMLAPDQGNRRYECAALLFKTLNSFLLLDGDDRAMPRLRADGRLLTQCAEPSGAAEQLVQISLMAASEHTAEDFVLRQTQGDVVHRVLLLLTAICAAHPAALEALTASEHARPWTMQCLLRCEHVLVRVHTLVCLARLCTRLSPFPIELDANSLAQRRTDDTAYNARPSAFFFNMLLPELPELDARRPDGEQLMTLLNHLLLCSLSAGAPVCELRVLLDTVLALLQAHPVVEVRQSAMPEDRHLVALFGLAGSVVGADAELQRWAGARDGGDLLQRVCVALFETPSADNHGPHGPPLCKTRGSRVQAFNLLEALCRGCVPNHRALMDRLLTHHELPRSYKEAVERRSYGWRYHPAGMAKAPCGYVGLRNLGATCYLNSLMQQFFMIPEFRRGILAMHDEVADESSAGMFMQLQSIFANLQESEKQFYDTVRFCENFRDLGGQPINPRVQMDVDEFFNVFLDRLETSLKGTPSERILQRFFGGCISNQIISKECEHVSEREETFYTISVGVKGKKTLQESLDLYVEGDMLAGDNKYRCDRCENHVDALKRCCLSALPNTLIIHLRRFDFDVELLRRVKVNDHLEFPVELNMEPYTKEGLDRAEAERQGKEAPPLPHPDGYYRYELTGILVHTGTADSGHYYSFIREREPVGGGPRRWLQFNDETVEYFDERDIPGQCFGGSEATSRWNPTTGREISSWQEKSYSAYMLFYDRVGAYSGDAADVQHAPEGADGAVAAPAKAFADMRDLARSSDLIKPEIFQQLWVENMRFLKHLNVFDADYFRFLWSVVRLNGCGPPPRPTADGDSKAGDGLACVARGGDAAAAAADDRLRLQSIQLAVHFLCETLSRSKECKLLFCEYADDLVSMLARHRAAARWMCEETLRQEHWLEDLLLETSNDEARAGFARIVSGALEAIKEEERRVYMQPEGGDGAAASGEAAAADAAALSGEQLQRAGELIFIEGFANPIKSASVSVRLIDRLFDLLPHARKCWRNFCQFFMVLANFAAMGEPERVYLASRNAVAHLIHFYLQNDSPVRYVGEDVLMALPRIGETYKVADVHFIVAFLRHMVLGCRRVGAETQPPTLLKDADALKLRALDEACLMQERLYSRALEDGINKEHLAEMAQHLAWEDEEFSRMLVDRIAIGVEVFERDKYDSFLYLVEALVGMEDSVADVRRNVCLRRFVVTVSDNLMYALSSGACIRFLATTESAVIRQWLVDNCHMWMKRWLLSGYEMIRDRTEALVYSVVRESPDLATLDKLGPDESTPELSPEAIASIRTLYHEMCRLLHAARSLTNRDVRYPRSKTTTAISHNQPRESVSPGPTAAFRLCAFFRVLKWCIRGQEDRDYFMQEEVFRAFWNVFDDMDKWKFETDPQKLEATRVLWHVLRDNPQYVPQLTARDVVTRLMDHFICLRQSDREIYYNKSAVPAFYRIMAFLAKHDHSFRDTFSEHRNFDWAITNVIMAREYQEGAEELFTILEPTSVRSTVRQMYIPKVCRRTYEIVVSWPNTIRCLQQLLRDDADIQLFCASGGVEVLSKMSDLSENSIHTKESKKNISNALELFRRATEWMRSNPGAAATDTALRGWESSGHLLSSLFKLMERSSDHPILASTYAVVFDMCFLPGPFLDGAVTMLRISHQKFYDTMVLMSTMEADFDGETLPSSMRPVLKVHRSRGDAEHDAAYYGFVLDVCEAALLQQAPTAERTAAAADLLLMVASESADVQDAHVRAIGLLERMYIADAAAAALLHSNRKLPRLVARLLTTDSSALAGDAVLRFVARVFQEAATAFTSADVDVLVQTVSHDVFRSDTLSMLERSDAFEGDNLRVLASKPLGALRAFAILRSLDEARDALDGEAQSGAAEVTEAASMLLAMTASEEARAATALCNRLFGV